MSDFRDSLAKLATPKPKPVAPAAPVKRKRLRIHSIKDLTKRDLSPYYFALYLAGAVATLFYMSANGLLLKWTLAQCIFAVLVWPIPALESLN